MIKIEFYVGTQYAFDKTELTVGDVLAATKAGEELLVENYDGFTRAPARGAYRDFPPESSCVYTCFVFGGSLDDAEFSAAGVAKRLAVIWRQESVLFSVQEIGGGLAFAKSGQI